MNIEINDKDGLKERLKEIGNYKLVVPCAGTKRDEKEIGLFYGKKIVAHPKNENEVRPFDKIKGSENKTWYDLVLGEQNTSKQLLPASELYSPNSFETLTKNYSNKRGDLYILSAGWGIVRSDFKLPLYDITFSAAEKNKELREKKQRKIDEKIDDLGCDYSNDWKNANELEFNHLLCDIKDDSKVPIVFVGGKSYLCRFYHLMKDIKNPVYILHRSKPLNNNWTFYRVGDEITTANTNWHYNIADILGTKK